MRWHQLAERVLEGQAIARAEALDVLAVPEEELLDLVSACYRVRRHYHGKRVKLNMLINAKSGLCAEDCGYCSQSIVAHSGVDRYPLQSKEVLLEGARQALAVNAHTYCIVISGRRPTPRELDHVIAAVREIKQQYPLRICCCLGLLDDAEAQRLKDAGVERINHNLNTSEDHYGEICSTHTYADRVGTVEAVKRAGVSSCSGGILGMGESDAQIVDLAFALREMDVDSIPLNFLIPIAGTPLGGVEYLTPQKCLAILCLFRLVNPSKEIRIAGGREYHLRSLQPLGLYVADSIFIGDYLTTRGEVPEQDLRMLEDTGFEPALPPGLQEVPDYAPGIIPGQPFEEQEGVTRASVGNPDL
ncbi:MAG: biotin synthase BioB [Acidobacteria bacterium RIFCSPLOWO2_02_FULL_61_28]|nr:MAG: biotin synthase BioB [Acidobacteria bacterium RIFCSPLOWO2_02_FULL_61_28]